MTKKVFRKELIFGITIIFFITMLFPAFEASFIESNVLHENTLENSAFTHTVFAEESTTTWCGYCPGASAQLYQVYNLGYDFEFVSLVADMNPYAESRRVELGVTGYPTVNFDGNYQKVVGLQPSYVTYENSVINAGARSVANINIDLSATWLGDGQIEVNTAVTNNGASSYNGHIHVYVTEKVSRWNDASGTPYHYAMINNYALNEMITLSSGQTQIYSVIWSGYSDITLNNIRVIASVFDQSTMNVDESAATNPQEGGGGGGGGGGDLNRPFIFINNPSENETVNNTIKISGNAYDLNGTIKYVFLKIGENEDWIEPEGTEHWELTWNTTTFEDGIYFISAVAINNHGIQSGISYRKVNVKNNESEEPEPEKIPDLKCEGALSWTDLTPGDIAYGSFIVKNIGDAGSLLNWTVTEYPDWGTWYFIPPNGDNVKPEDGVVTIEVEVTAPDLQETNFSGQIKIENKDNTSDYEIIDVSLTTYKNKQINILSLLIEKLFQRFPMFEKILNQIILT
jgi:hypothetical protein